jgi:hypothetical protein
MSANVDYSDFNVSTFNEANAGTHFIWAGELYQKVKPRIADDGDSVTEHVNVIRPRDGEFFCFFGEEQVVPVDINIEVIRRGI